MKKVINIQNLIEDYLTSNKDKTIISQKIGYRTFSIKEQELNEKIKKTRTFLEKSKIKKGKPSLTLNKQAKSHDLSISHNGNYAIAVVVFLLEN